MPPRRELCKNFARGSCRYGDSCRYLHTTPQQSKPNPFGFGMQNGSGFQQANQGQQTPNPFGFGVQNNTQPRGGSDFGSKQNQFKPFENKWIRGSAPKQSTNQPAAATHECTDLESCKRIIAEDLQNEKPQWKLTCYGHNRDGPCDIFGDISPEELRALAYDEAKRGLSVNSIVDRERNLLNSKLAEYQSLLQNPYVVPSDANFSTQSPFSLVAQNSPSTVQTGTPVSGFGQLNASLNTATVRPATPSNYTFGQSIPFQNNNQASNVFPTANTAENRSGLFSSQSPSQTFQNPMSFGPSSFNIGAVRTHGNPFSTSGMPLQMAKTAEHQSPVFPSGPSIASNDVQQFVDSIQLTHDMPREKSTADASIWQKEWRFNSGEIPEEPPPDEYIH